MQWIGHLGRLTEGSPIKFVSQFPLGDRTTVKFEVWFKSLDKPADVDDLKSMELTGACLCECAEMPKAIVDVLKTRIGRYPMTGPSWVGIWGESNPPNIRSHWYETLEEERPAGHRVFRQPQPLIYQPGWNGEDDPSDIRTQWRPNPEAENIRAEMGGYDYYYNMMLGMDYDSINVFVLGNYGTVKSGRPVYPEYQSQAHRALNALPVERGRLVVVGMDFGLDAAAVPTQMNSLGALFVWPEILARPRQSDFGMDLETFVLQKLKPRLVQQFAGCPILIVGDPSSDRRSDVSVLNAFSILSKLGFSAQRAITNDPRFRQEAVRYFLKYRNGFFLDPRATVLHEGFTGSYQFEEKMDGATSRVIYKAKKDEFSHPHDALQYAAMYHYKGATDAEARAARPRPTRMKQGYLYV